MSAHQNYLEAPYAAADAETEAVEYWEENIAPEDYNRAVENETVIGTEAEDGDFTPLPFHEWIVSSQGGAYFEDWLNEMRYGY